ncbi:MAG: TRAP transporter small permease [Rhodobacteraceae bacterium]|nr:TRAP transporter small permease [Paracoccaceae bacterium]
MNNTDFPVNNRLAGRKLPAVIRAIDRMSIIFTYGATIGLVMLALTICVDVIGRAFFNSPLPGTLETTAYWWMPVLILLAFADTERRQEHIKVTILLDALPPRMRGIVEGTFGILATGLLVALAYYTLQDALKSLDYRQVTASKPPISIWPFKFVAVAGVVMLSLQVAATTFRHFAGFYLEEDITDSGENIE